MKEWTKIQRAPAARRSSRSASVYILRPDDRGVEPVAAHERGCVVQLVTLPEVERQDEPCERVELAQRVQLILEVHVRVRPGEDVARGALREITCDRELVLRVALGVEDRNGVGVLRS